MVRNKKISSFISFGLVVCLISAISISSIALIPNNISNNNENNIENIYPIGRDENYFHYELINYLSYEDIAKINQLSIIDNQYLYKISENSLISCIEKIIRDALEKHKKFKENAKKYKIDISYWINEKSQEIYLDVVWFLPYGYENYYYDQFEVIMK